MAKSVLLITSNGWGLGHLVRQLAIANQMPPEVRCTIFTLSQAANVAARHNLEYAPSYTQPWLRKGEWHGGYLRDRIVAIANEVDADVIVFDGVVPYVGLRDAFSHLKAERVWMRRGLWTRKANRAPLRASSWFDLIIEPADLGAAFDQGPTARRNDAVKIGVVTEANSVTALSREAAAFALGIDPNQRTLLINIGSSAIGDLTPLANLIDELSDWQIVLTKDELGRARELSRVKVLDGVFPLHPYLRAIDLAVSSVGYNAAHELVAMGIPTVWVPAPTTTDDQFARAKAIAQESAGWAVTDQSAAAVADQLRYLTRNPNEVAAAAARCRELAAGFGQGAAEAAELIVNVEPKAKRERWRTWLLLQLRVWLESRFGDTLRRKPRAFHDGFTMTTTLNRELLASTEPFEHLLPSARAEYREVRTAIAQRWLQAEQPAKPLE